MARNSIDILVPLDTVWSVLTDAYAYPKWVVGIDRTLGVDPHWPQPGARFKVHLALGATDHTTLLAIEPRKRVILEAASKAFGPARVRIELAPVSGGGTHVTLTEDPAGKLRPLRYVPPVHLTIKVRNVVALRRLRDIAVKAGTRS